MRPALAILLALSAVARAGMLEFKELVKEQTAAADVETVATDFAFTNRTDKAVTITGSDPGCDCLTISVSGGKLRYEPGESGVIRTVFKVGNELGTVEKGVALWVDTDPAAKPSLRLQLKIHIPVLIGLSPSKTVAWDLGGSAEPKAIHISMAEGNPANVTRVISSKDSFACELKIIEKGVKYDLVVTPKSTATPDLGFIRIETDSKISKQKTEQVIVAVCKPAAVPVVSGK